jgi:excisionase family DNA binding protein
MNARKTTTDRKVNGDFPKSPRRGTLAYAGERLGQISLPTVYKLIREGKLRTFKIGRAHRVSDQAIADCIALLESETTRNAAAV